MISLRFIFSTIGATIVAILFFLAIWQGWGVAVEPLKPLEDLFELLVYAVCTFAAAWLSIGGAVLLFYTCLLFDKSCNSRSSAPPR